MRQGVAEAGGLKNCRESAKFLGKSGLLAGCQILSGERPVDQGAGLGEPVNSREGAEARLVVPVTGGLVGGLVGLGLGTANFC